MVQLQAGSDAGKGIGSPLIMKIEANRRKLLEQSGGEVGDKKNTTSLAAIAPCRCRAEFCVN